MRMYKSEQYSGEPSNWATAKFDLGHRGLKQASTRGAQEQLDRVYVFSRIGQCPTRPGTTRKQIHLSSWPRFGKCGISARGRSMFE